ncbi:hypothetical protein [Nocardia sp. NPDC057668]|uniref:hypothetical protein n=1 Tax=Nocardia sp. NPDC057668 TaxID=3346202 RepID=UPI00366D765D
MFNHLEVGAWVQITRTCPIRVTVDECRESATAVFGSPPREFEISLDPTALASLVQHCTAALRLVEAQSKREFENDHATRAE